MKGNLPIHHLACVKLLTGMFISFSISSPSFAQSYLTDVMAHHTSADGLHPSVLPQYFDVTITGTVTDQSGKPLPGVTVIIEDSSTGTVTDLNGKYTITVPEGSSLVFSFVGYSSETREVGDQSIINITLSEDLTALDEVIVTALGIKREAKSLGYTTSTVDSEEMTINRTPNFMNALQGKVAGVNITTLGSGPAGTSKIRIRGQSSVSGQNQPLIVVNGVPIDNTNFGANPNNRSEERREGDSVC